jgi:hypothetical protein
MFKRKYNSINTINKTWTSPSELCDVISEQPLDFYIKYYNINKIGNMRFDIMKKELYTTYIFNQGIEYEKFIIK